MLPPSPAVFEVLDAFLAAHPQLRSRDQQRAVFRRHVIPVLGDELVKVLKRSHIADLMDLIEDNAGAVAADRTLAYLRRALNWYAARVDDFTPPFVKGMTRSKGNPRTRVLRDAEIRRIWHATSDGKPFSRYVRVALLTGQRRSEVARMSWYEIDGNTWTIPERRYKAKQDHPVHLSSAALLELGEPGPRGPYVFSVDGGEKPINCFGKALNRLHAASNTDNWSSHDLRRTCRTRLAALGVGAELGQLILGQGKRGMERVYNHHKYELEIRNALDVWSVRLAEIVNGNPPGAPAKPVLSIRANSV